MAPSVAALKFDFSFAAFADAFQKSVTVAAMARNLSDYSNQTDSVPHGGLAVHVCGMDWLLVATSVHIEALIVCSFMSCIHLLS